MMNKKMYGKIIVACMIAIIMILSLFLFYQTQENITLANLYIMTQKFLPGNNVIQYASANSVCKINRENKRIILRLDDVRAGQYPVDTQKVVNEILSRNMDITLGIIPQNLNKDFSFIYWINKIKKDSRVEIALHGLDHGDEEFGALSDKEAYDRLVKGKAILKEYLNLIPSTFIPPENVYSDGTEKALTTSGFKVISASRNDFSNNENLIYLGYNARTYNFPSEVFVTADETLKECDAQLANGGVCVIMIHPQDYLTKDHREINPERYKEFLKLLDGIEARKIETGTFRDAISCS